MIDVKTFVLNWKEKLKIKIQEMSRKPSLGIVQVGDNEASNRYVRNKVRDAQELGINVYLSRLTEDQMANDDELRRYVGELAEKVDGIIVQLPLPSKFHDIQYILSDVPAHKDVDGLSGKPGAQVSCTPLGIIEFINGMKLVKKPNKKAVVIGRSNLVGRPMAKLLLDNDYTVSVCHSKTEPEYLRELIKNADLVICAVGKKNFLDCSDINVPVIDVGINFDDNGKLVGDCYLREEKTEETDLRTPVPGGVGLLTRCALMLNTVRSCEYENSMRESKQED